LPKVSVCKMSSKRQTHDHSFTIPGCAGHPMTDRWLVTIEVWPHSTGNGAKADQEAAGNRSQDFAVRAEGIAVALELAECIAQGMRTNPMVWRAPIVSIVSENEYKRRTNALPSQQSGGRPNGN
jgi:hypothetical protein